MFEGAYDHTNDKMHIHCYQKKTGKQFVDFIKRIDKRYHKNIQNIFVVLDNLSVHKSKKVKEDISKCCPRIKVVFLPVRSPELNLIEVEDGCGYKGRRQLTIPPSKTNKK